MRDAIPNAKVQMSNQIQNSNVKNILDFELWHYVENKMVKNLSLFVIPAKAGIYAFGVILDSRLRGNDNPEVLV
jgi:hypothetical protein